MNENPEIFQNLDIGTKENAVKMY